MGKSKQQQRTKGNLKASSSSRAAELLESLGGAQGFGGGIGGYVPITQNLDEADSSVDSDIRMVMRKLTKRDTTTKIKALQELAVLCQEKEVEEIQAVLPFWPRLYNKLSIDHERKVREGCQLTMRELVMRLGRDIAPQLKAVIGPWLVAQCDPYSQAAAAAKCAFSSVFSPAKQKDTLVFCMAEIIAHIEDNLLNQTPDTMSDKKITTPEDMQSKYERTVACSLSAWRMFLLTVPPQETLVERYTHILGQAKFWKLHTHSSLLIRGSFYSALSALCKVHPTLIRDQFSEKACTSTMYKIDETSPQVVSQLWEAILYVLNTVEDWYKKINPQKGFLPKLFKLLKSGGDPSPEIVYPNLLPLLSKLPSELTCGEGSTFLDQFFDSIKLSLCSESLTTNQQTVDVIVKSYIECVRYYCVTLSNPVLVSNLVEKINPVLQASIVEHPVFLSHSTLYTDTANFVAYISKLLRDDNSKQMENYDSLQTLNKSLWEKIRANCINPIKQEETQIDRPFIYDRIAILIVALGQQKSSSHGVKPKAKSYTDGDDGGEIQVEIPFPDELFAIICDVSVLCYSKILMGRYSMGDLNLLFSLLKAYQKEEVLVYLIKDDFDAKCNAYEYFLDKIIIQMLSEEFQSFILNADSHTDVVELLIGVFVDLVIKTDNIAAYLSKILQKIQQSSVLLSAFANKLLVAVTDHQFTEKEIMHWLRGLDFGEAITQMTYKLCEVVNLDGGQGDIKASEKQEVCLNLLVKVIAPGNDQSPLLGPEHLESVMKELLHTIPSQQMLEVNNREEMTRSLQFVCKLATSLFQALKEKIFISHAEKVLLALLNLYIRWNPSENQQIMSMLSESWLVGAQYIKQCEGDTVNGFCTKAGIVIKEVIVLKGLGLTRIEHLYDIITKLIEFLPNQPLKETLYNDIMEVVPPFKVPTNWQYYTQDSEPLLHTSQESDKESKKDVCDTEGKREFSHSEEKKGVCAFDLGFLYFRSQISNFLNPHSKGEDLSKENIDLCLGMALWEMYADSKLNCSITTAKDIVNVIGETLDRLLDSEEAKIRVTQQFLNLALTEQEGFYTQGLKFVLKKSAGFVKYQDVEDLLDPLESYCNMQDSRLADTLVVLIDMLDRDTLCNFGQILVATIKSLPQESQQQIQGYYIQIALLTKVLSRMLSVVIETGQVLSIKLYKRMKDCGEGGKIVITEAVNLVSTLIEWNDKYEELFSGTRCGDWGSTMFSIQVMRFMECMIHCAAHYITPAQWDFILCRLMWWLQEMLGSHAIRTHLLRLLSAVAECMFHLECSRDPQYKAFFPPDVLTEWNEFFSGQGFNCVLPLFFKMLTNKDNPEDTTPHFIQSLCGVVIYCSADHLLNQDLPVNLTAEDHDGVYPDNFTTLLNTLSVGFAKSEDLNWSQLIQQTVFTLMTKLIPEMWKHEEEKNPIKEDEEKRVLPRVLWEIIEHRSESMLIWLESNGAELGESWIPKEDSEMLELMSYFYGWRLVIDLVKTASPAVRACYASHLRDSGAIDALLYVLFCIMPTIPVSTWSTGKQKQRISMFMQFLPLQFKGYWSVTNVQQCACTVYNSVLEELPVLVRQWWNKQDRRVADIVDKFTSKYVSPHLCEKQIGDVKPEAFKDSNIAVKTRPVTREVIATYTVDDASLEVVVSLPANHPLGAVRVEQGRKVGIGQTQWRNWMLQLTTFLQHQNGSIVTGLALWKRNVDKRFEGVEECYVCYSVIHGTTCQLPRLQCKTCKKKFHSSCLYKWFNTSNNSTCPLCRNLF